MKSLFAICLVIALASVADAQVCRGGVCLGGPALRCAPNAQASVTILNVDACRVTTQRQPSSCRVRGVLFPRVRFYRGPVWRGWFVGRIRFE